MSRLYCGACGWNYRHWKGIFYPEELSQKKWLAHYATRFDTVEINASFYRLPERKTFEHWRDETPDGFTFAVKGSRYLTHIKKLSEPEEPLSRILDHSEGLCGKRGPILFQFPPNWGSDLARLEAFLKLLPEGVRTTFEFRNDSWHNDRLWSLLARYSAAYCMMDSPGLPLHAKTTAPFSYVRMHSGGERSRGNYTDKHLREWAERIEELLGRGDVYIYFNNDNEGFAVKNAFKIRQMIEGASSAHYSRGS